MRKRLIACEGGKLATFIICYQALSIWALIFLCGCVYGTLLAFLKPVLALAEAHHELGVQCSPASLLPAVSLPLDTCLSASIGYS